MSRTDIDPATLAKALRSMAGDGSMGWVTDPIQAGFLRDVADALDENVKLREQLEVAEHNRTRNVREYVRMCHENDDLRELVRESLMDYRQYAEKYGLPPYLDDVNEHLDARLRELGIEVDE